MVYNFNGTILNLKDELCRLWDNDIVSIPAQTNLYIRVSNICNAHCGFCEYHGNEVEFDFSKLESALHELSKRNIVYKIQITGGETTLDCKRLSNVIKLVRHYFVDNFIGVNTNGSNLNVLEKLIDRIDNVAISRHHYSDRVNSEIFGTDAVPTQIELKKFIQKVGKDKVHFSCNLMRDYIGNIEEIKRYLDFCIDTGCFDIGFVTLMPINDYARQQQILFDNCGIENDDKFYKYRQFTKCGNCCRCANYMYANVEKSKIVDIYGRFVSQPDNTTGLLSFDGKNLRVGFNGDIISIR